MPNFDPYEPFLEAIDKAIDRAGSLMDLMDVDCESDDYEVVADERHHCGICMVRTVMEEVWPAVEDYINYLKYRTN